MKVTLLCGKICCGKSTYVKELLRTRRAVLLSVDELMLSVLPPQLGELHDEVSERAQSYLLSQAERLLDLGIEVILDWGFWQKESRRAAEEFFRSRGFETEWVYFDLSEDEWQRRIENRNREAPGDAYHVDANLKAKCEALFEEPSEAEGLHVVVVSSVALQ